MDERRREELDRFDRETAERIIRICTGAERQIRRIRRGLHFMIQEAVAEHRERIAGALQAPVKEKPREKVDYERLYAIMIRQPLTYDIIKAETGLNDSGVAQVITMLSLKYPVWDPAKGIYELLR
jgi:hypothetical protein